MKIKKGDTVKVLYGKDAGKKSTVLKVILKQSKLIVDGLNTYKKHLKGDGQKRQSEILDVVKPMNIARVMLVCPVCGKDTRVMIKRENGKAVRVCKVCGKNIDKVVEKSEVKKEIKKTVKKKVISKK